MQAAKKESQAPPCGIDLQKVLIETFGDPDCILPAQILITLEPAICIMKSLRVRISQVLKLKPTAGKYDFKDRIADLQAMICPLKNALSDQRLKAKALQEVAALDSAHGSM